MEELLSYQVDEQYVGVRIDKVLSEIYPRFSRSKIQNMIDNEDILVNDKLVKASYKLKENDEIALSIYPDASLNVEPEDIPLDIVYEDDDLIIINKVQGMVVHPANGHHSGTLVNALLYHFKSLSNNDSIRPGIVHRIDKDTSGLLMVAKNDKAHEKLSAQLKDKTAYREYIALVKGEIDHNEGKIIAPIGRHPKDRKKMAVVNGGKDAITHFSVLERYNGYTLIKCVLETGRTHQIRVHLAYIGYPIVGDVTYGKKDNLHLNGQLLHAKTLSLIHPRSNKRVTFSCELPEYFDKVLSILKEKGTL